MRYWLGVLVGHLIFAVSVGWVVQHISQIYSVGLFAVLRLKDPSAFSVAANLVGLGIIYAFHLNLWLALFRLWRSWFQRFRATK